MKKELKNVAMGIVIGAIITSGIAYAKSRTEMLEVTYDNIKVYKDNVLCELKDANGSTIEPFIANGTTYMPVRGTANLADMQVTWDGATQSVYLWDEMVPEGTPFLEVCSPYDSKNCTIYLSSEGDSFEMSGEKYSNGFAFRDFWGGKSGNALFNLNSKYSTIECTIGHAVGQNSKSVSFIVDGRTVNEIELEDEALPKTVSIPVNYGLQLKIVGDGGIGIGNMTVR